MKIPTDAITEVVKDLKEWNWDETDSPSEPTIDELTASIMPELRDALSTMYSRVYRAASISAATIVFEQIAHDFDANIIYGTAPLVEIWLSNGNPVKVPLSDLLTNYDTPMIEPDDDDDWDALCLAAKSRYVAFLRKTADSIEAGS